MSHPLSSAQIRQSFMDFFASKGHAIVPSASLMPTAPNLLFTNAGMNPFVPFFLGERSASETRVADTQKCIRAGGKHNDLDDVGLDTYHQTFFEMLGNWSFGDYFKAEAIEWAWELLTKVWGFPKERLYVTVYKPGPGDPADFDAEAYALWSKVLQADGLDPATRILTGGKKDNFWMMGDTGPCGPCSEIHMDLTPDGDSNGALVNADSPFCIELWNLVFIQFNANEDGSFVPLKARHIDTGMGFERVAGIVATTKGFTDFSQPPSNYNCDLFSPIFAALSAACGQSYGATLPANPQQPSAAEARDIAFRVIADHIRTLCCAIADGILPGNEGRNYVLRRILRRAVLYGRKLHLPAGFFAQLVPAVVNSLGGVFPELQERQAMIAKVITAEESAFDRTIERGLHMLERLFAEGAQRISGADAFTLYDTHGFPLDLTQLVAAEHGASVDEQGFHAAMEAQRERARAARQTTVVRVTEETDAAGATRFVGYDRANLLQFSTTLRAVAGPDDAPIAILEASPCYAEMGGQLGDTGTLEVDGIRLPITNTTKDPSGLFQHALSQAAAPLQPGAQVTVSVDLQRRRAIERHHTATHILHYALRKVLGTHVQQAGSFVGPDRLRFDFAHFEQIAPAQLQEIEAICNARILENAAVNCFEVPFDAKPDDVIAFFGEKYGDVVRVVDIGGWSKELCGGTHVLHTGEIGLLKLVSESAIAAGVRRVEAVVGDAANALVNERFAIVQNLAKQFSAKPAELESRVSELRKQLAEADAELKSLRNREAQRAAHSLADAATECDGLKIFAQPLQAADPNALRDLAAKLLGQLGEGVVVTGCAFGPKVTVLAVASPAAIAKGFKAGDIIRQLTPKLGGKGGGKPDFAMGGGSQPDALPAALKDWLQSLTNAS